MPTFHHEFVVRAPLQAVVEFHSSTRALMRLTPPPIIPRLQRADPLGEGSLSSFTLWFGPLPVRWVAMHSEVRSERGFTDVQVRGPMQAWKHIHRFAAIDGHTTRVSDHIEYEHPAGWRGLLTRLLFGSAALRVLFAYRAWTTRRLVEGR